MSQADTVQNPFRPSNPVSPELFVGRQSEVERILERGIRQVVAGRSSQFFIQGEYGIGKSSIATYTLRIGQRDHQLLGLYATLGGAVTLLDLTKQIVQATLDSGIYDPNFLEKTRNILAKYIGKQTLFSLTLDFEKLKTDFPTGFEPGQLLDFLQRCLERTSPIHRGVFLVLDEINGIASQPMFAHFLKSLVEANARRRQPIPLLLVLCGTPERRQQMIACHSPVTRLFEVIDVGPMPEEQVRQFYRNAFEVAGLTVQDQAIEAMVYGAAGLPNVMQLIGESVYFRCRNDQRARSLVTEQLAYLGIREAAEELGRREVNDTVLRTIRSADYHQILQKLMSTMTAGVLEFRRKDLESALSAAEKKKLNNFLQKMKKLNVIGSTQERGTYRFHVRMVQTYLWLKYRTP